MIDLNCDIGENIGDDASIMPFITSANIACGYHAGDGKTMRETVRLAKRYSVNVGAHPSWRDPEGFGRREQALSPMTAVEALILEQIGALNTIAEAEGVRLIHVKPHGALYNQAAKAYPLAKAIAQAVKRFNAKLILVGLAGSKLIEAGVEAGLQIANEGFADRRYNSDGTLVSRDKPGAIIATPTEAAAHALELIQRGILFGGKRIQIDTLCLHGDHPHATENAKLIRALLQKQDRLAPISLPKKR